MGEWPFTVRRAQKMKKKTRRFANWLNEACISWKKKQNFVFFVSFFFHFFSPYFQPWLAALVVFPTIPQLLMMFCFVMPGSQVDLYFWNRMPVYFAGARGAYKSIASILFTRVKFTCVRTQKLRDSGNPPLQRQSDKGFLWDLAVIFR